MSCHFVSVPPQSKITASTATGVNVAAASRAGTMTSMAEARAYGATTRTLHWVTVLALLAQFTVGYLLDVDDSGGGRGRGRGGESGRGRGRGGDDDSALDLGWNLVTAHVSLGLLIVLLAVARVAWRRRRGPAALGGDAG